MDIKKIKSENISFRGKINKFKKNEPIQEKVILRQGKKDTFVLQNKINCQPLKPEK